MCTVTYLPKSGASFILTSSRDERASRPSAELPKIHTIHGQKIIFPKDPVSGGTWIGISFKGQMICVINGAYEKHISDPPYRKSRGLVALDLFKYKNVQSFASQYGFINIEPFTMVVGDGLHLVELRWDGKKLDLNDLDAKQPYTWSSVNLYSPKEISDRNEAFSRWIKDQKEFRVEDIRQFHHFGTDGIIYDGTDEEKKLTVSLTSIVKDDSSIKVIYEDLLNDSLYMQSF